MNSGKNTQEANRIYLFTNILSLLFMTFILLAYFRVTDVYLFERTTYTVTILLYVVMINILQRYALGKGGVGNPLRKIKVARTLHYVSLALFGGGFLMLFVQIYYGVYLLIPALLVDVVAVILAHTKTEDKMESDVLDDFEPYED